MIPDTRQILNTPSTDQDNGVFLKIVSLSRDISRNLNTVRQANTGNFSQSRIRLLGGGGIDTRTDTSLLR
jgi:CobQ-like glutamine amidotransferase family enzyme